MRERKRERQFSKLSGVVPHPRTSKKKRKIAGSLRLWLACLPEPVLPARLYHPLLAAASIADPPTRVRALQALLRQAGTEALQVLFPLLEFLHHYQLNQRAAANAAALAAQRERRERENDERMGEPRAAGAAAWS